MSIVRKNIRNAIVAVITGETDAGSRVYANRIRPVWDNEFPVVIVRTVSEDTEIYATAPIEYERTLHVEIELQVTADDSVDDVMDIIGAQLEDRMCQDHTLGELCHDVILTGSAMTLDKDGDNLYAALVLRYDVIYHTNPAIDAENLEYLNRVDVEYELVDSGSGTEQATDIITGLGD